jgi:hypothetical protein
MPFVNWDAVNWDAITAIASVFSMAAFILTALYIRGQLQAAEKDRYLAITNQLFDIWQSGEFMQHQLWLLHRLEETTWQSFVEAHRADQGEIAFHRVGSFYDRVGTLVRLGYVDEAEILSTMGAHAIAVWQKIEPLIREARHIENSVLFDDFERLLPACYECYVPALGSGAKVIPFSLDQPGARSGAAVSPAEAPVERIEAGELRRLLRQHAPITLLDVRSGEASLKDRLPGAVHIPAAEIEQRVVELPRDREVITYCT